MHVANKAEHSSSYEQELPVSLLPVYWGLDCQAAPRAQSLQQQRFIFTDVGWIPRKGPYAYCCQSAWMPWLC